MTIAGAIAIAFAAATTLVGAGQAPSQTSTSARVEFDVVSIKRNVTLGGGGIRTTPDGSVIVTDEPIQSVLLSASPVPVREAVGVPDWVNTERYDLHVKPPAGSTQEQRRLMWQTMFANRMKLVAHVEQRERTTYSLVVARSDGKLGPQLKPSTLDCAPRPAGAPPPPPQPPPSSTTDFQTRCGMRMGRGTIVSGGMRLDRLVLSLAGLAGGTVFNRTGLDGYWAFTVTYSPPRGLTAAPDAAAADDGPDIFVALEEQLGLKLVPEKTMQPVFVVDHIERPTED